MVDTPLDRLAPAVGRNVGRELGEGFEHETTLVHPGVRDLQVRGVDRDALDPEDVDVEGPRTPPHVADTPGSGLDAMAHAEECVRVQVGVELDDEVQEAPLLRTAHRVGLVHVGDGDDIGQRGDRRTQVGAPVAEVGAEAQERPGHDELTSGCAAA